jgi:hypothetical protein
MTAKAILDVNAVIAAYDFAHWGQIADIGGGRGHLLRAILKAAPGAERLLFDLPMVIDTLDQPRLTLQAGDFFVDALPSADAYILMEVLHDWPDKQCGAILSAIRQAAPDNNATVLVVEDLMPEEQSETSARRPRCGPFRDARRMLRPAGARRCRRGALLTRTLGKRSPPASRRGRPHAAAGARGAGPFSMASEVRTRALLADAGFTAVRTEQVSLSLPQGEGEAITAQLKEAFARFLTDRRYELPDVSLDAVAS